MFFLCVSFLDLDRPWCLVTIHLFYWRELQNFLAVGELFLFKLLKIINMSSTCSFIKVGTLSPSKWEMRWTDKKPLFLDKGNVNLSAPISFDCVSVTLYFPGCGEWFSGNNDSQDLILILMYSAWTLLSLASLSKGW